MIALVKYSMGVNDSISFKYNMGVNDSISFKYSMGINDMALMILGIA